MSKEYSVLMIWKDLARLDSSDQRHTKIESNSEEFPRSLRSLSLLVARTRVTLQEPQQTKAHKAITTPREYEVGTWYGWYGCMAGMAGMGPTDL